MRVGRERRLEPPRVMEVIDEDVYRWKAFTVSSKLLIPCIWGIYHMRPRIWPVSKGHLHKASYSSRGQRNRASWIREYSGLAWQLGTISGMHCARYFVW